MSPWRPVGETGRILNKLYGLYGITAVDIRRHGGPGVVTLSRLKRQPSSVPVREEDDKNSHMGLQMHIALQ